MNLPSGFTISSMREGEVAQLEAWAAAEGWNPGLSDLRIAWRIDPEAFIALRHGETLAGGGTIFRYGSRFGFMGLFIMRADMRGKGLGRALWHWRRDTLLGRLEPGATIGMDGVFDMVPFYERGGFKPAYRDLRYQGIASGRRSDRVILLTPADHGAIEAFDRAFVPAPRNAFLEAWLTQPGAYIAGIRENGNLVAYGVARPCRVGYKIGPLFAQTPDRAEDILADLCARIEGQQVQIDIPEPNAAALEIAERFHLSMSFGCVRLYHGPDPLLPVARIFGVTSLEFG
jgi:GNAT superfamily N-acetyltransferase